MRDPSETYSQGSDRTQLGQDQHIGESTNPYTQERPPDRYYLFDVGSSRQYPSRGASDVPPRGYDLYGSSIPEHRHGGQSNPFRTDIYCLGIFVQKAFLQVRVTWV
jgi:hypothetical protein